MKEVSKNPKCCGLERGTEKWIPGREAIERTLNGVHVFLTGKGSGKSPRSIYPWLAKKLATVCFTAPLRCSRARKDTIQK